MTRQREDERPQSDGLRSAAPTGGPQARIGLEWAPGLTLGEILGSGGSASVYASALADGTPVAVKVLNPDWRNTPGLSESLEFEAALLGDFDTPSLPGFVGKGRLRGTGEPYLIMERLQGAPMNDVLRRFGGQLSAADAVHITLSVLDGLAVLHARRVVHRDIKPANLWLRTTGQATILDLGSSFYLDAEVNRPEDQLIGSPSYMAPEQAVNPRLGVDMRSDVFAMGATLYQMLAGRPVRQAPTLREQFRTAATTPIVSLLHTVEGLPAPVMAVVDKALAWVPADRYEDADAMRRALLDACDQCELPQSPLAIRSSVELEFATSDMDEPADEIVSHEVLGQLLTSLRELFRRMSRVVLAHRSLPAGSPEFALRMEPVLPLLPTLVEHTGQSIEFEVRANAFTHRGAIVWQPEIGMEDVPFALFQSGIRVCRIRSGVTDDEVAGFLQWMSLDPLTDLPEDDDLSTVFHERRFEFIEAEIIEGFDIDMLDRLAEASAEIVMMTNSLFSLVRAESGKGSVASQMVSLLSREAGATGLFDPAESATALNGETGWRSERTRFMQWIVPTNPGDAARWTFRTARALVDAFERSELDGVPDLVTGRLRERLKEPQRDGEPLPLLPVLAAVATTAPRAMLGAIMSRTLQDGLGSRIVQAIGQFKTSDISAFPGGTRAVAALLRAVPGDADTQIVERWFEDESGPLSGAFANEGIRRMVKDPRLARARVAAAPELHALSILRALAELDIERILPTFRSATSSHHEAVQAAALALLLPLEPITALPVVARLLSQGTPQSRRTVLELIDRHLPAETAPVLASIAQEPSFHDRMLAERQTILVLLFRLQPDNARELMETLVKTFGFRQPAALVESRVLAGEVLTATFADQRTLKLLQTEAHRRLWSSARIRTAFGSLAAKLGRAIEAGEMA
jgi:serine/threonine protein kinase